MPLTYPIRTRQGAQLTCRPAPARRGTRSAGPSRGCSQQPSPAFRVCSRRSSSAGRPGAQGERAAWALGSRRGGHAALPGARRQLRLHTHTARAPANRFSGRSRRRGRSAPFIAPSARFPSRRRRLPAIPAGSTGANCATPAPAAPAPASSPPAHAAQQTRQLGAPASPAPRRRPPRGSDLPRSARRAQAARGRRGEAPATPESRRLPRHGGARGGERVGAGRRETRGRGAKVQAAPGSAAPRPRGLPSRNRVPRASAPETSSLPSSQGGHRARARAQGQSGRCPPTFPGPGLETSPKCVGVRGARLGRIPVSRPTAQRTPPP